MDGRKTFFVKVFISLQQMTERVEHIIAYILQHQRSIPHSAFSTSSLTLSPCIVYIMRQWIQRCITHNKNYLYMLLYKKININSIGFRAFWYEDCLLTPSLFLKKFVCNEHAGSSFCFSSVCNGCFLKVIVTFIRKVF